MAFLPAAARNMSGQTEIIFEGTRMRNFCSTPSVQDCRPFALNLCQACIKPRAERVRAIIRESCGGDWSRPLRYQGCCVTGLFAFASVRLGERGMISRKAR